MRARSGDEHGAAAVEFALVLPLLLILVMGTIEWGRFFFLQQLVVNAAREGARAGSVAVDGVESRAKTVAEGCLSASGLDVTKAFIVPLVSADSVIVDVEIAVAPITGLGIPVPAKAKARSEMRR